MDPASAAGLVMAALSLPQQLFSTGVVAYTTISDVRGMGRSLGEHYWLFKVQESRYLFWGMCHKGCSPGGLNVDQMPRPISEAIVNSLIQINGILEDKNTLSSRYGLERVGDLQPREFSAIRRESQRQQNMVARLHTSSSLLQKLQWVVRDQGRFADLIQQLTGLIDALYEMLPVPAGPWVNDTITAQTLADALITGRGSRPIDVIPGLADHPLTTLVERQRATIQSASREQVENSPTTLRPPFWNFSFDMQRLNFPGRDVIVNPQPHLRSWARLTQADAFSGQDFLMVEWRQYDLRRGEESKVSLQARLEALSKMLKEKPRLDSFRVFDCVGYFLDNSEPRFGLTFRFPSDYNPERDPVPMSLLEVMTSFSKDIPYLGDRYRLAYNLAESIHALHSTGWLHKSVCSRNILLFRKNLHPALPGVTQRPVSLETPYSTGFAMSRPDGPATDSSLTVPTLEVALYRHLDVQGFGGRAISKYRAIYDIYSLGMVLIEIATWQPIEDFYPRGAAPDINFGNILLQKLVPRLGASMGEQYMNVVRKCLEGSFERLASFSQDEYTSVTYKENVRQGLLWEVVNILRECRA
ncbi:uncharacterized protein PAC_17209 [Phialocephala subalpina]|uniref:Prion-inhibition and propagation HeLo domain-containing protein n=1 Tax=Phialocephala subalpina TaxID=576137 RepID=A0A1L7XQJ0_9HELO|nr:uncharacterized protein PAC_17209 [Phialocephala subalpina]